MDALRGMASQASQSVDTLKNNMRAKQISELQMADYISYAYMACAALAVVLAVFGVLKGYGDTAVATPQAGQKGACCQQCVQDPLKLMGLVVGAPLGIFVFLIGAMVYLLGGKTVENGVAELRRRKAARPQIDLDSAFKAAQEATAGKWILGSAVVIFVALMLTLFFTGPQGLAGHGLAPAQMQNYQSCGGQYTWCVACKPDTTLLMTASGGGALLAALIGAVLVYVGERYKEKQGTQMRAKELQ